MSDPVQFWLPARAKHLRVPCLVAALAGLYLLSMRNFLLFHTLVEVFALVVACLVFMVFWNARRILDNGFFLFVGIACLFAGVLDLLHALTYKGMSVFPGMGGDESIQLKTAGRWIASLSLLIAPLFVRRRINVAATLAAFSTVFALVLYLVFWDILPDFYAEGAGMTLFEHFSRCFSGGAFLAAAALLFNKRKEFDARVFRLLLAALIVSAASEFSSALSTDFYGALKVFAHFSEVLSLCLVYAALVEVGLREPLDVMFRSLKQSEESLRDSQKEYRRLYEQSEAANAALVQAARLREEMAGKERVEVQLVIARDTAEAANRAKSQFLANMSHEIRTPLNAILGFADLLRRGADHGDPAARQEYLATIYASSTHLLSLINDVLDLSKIEADKLEIERVPCSPHRLLAEVISVLRVRAREKGLSLDYEWTTPIPETIHSDPARLRQLLVNLIGNAVKFTPQGGVRVTGRMTAAGGRPQLEFSIIDTGVGIPQDQWKSIFDPFVQADNSVTRKFGGTGLGLAISRRIAKALGGRITVQSEVGKGSTFTAAVDTGPLEGVPMLEPSRADLRPASSRRPVEPPAAMPSGRVLVVEDGDANRKLISLVLRQAGLEVTTAENGQLGIDAAARHPFDLILMDMQMPVMDGYTAATLLRQRGLTVPIFALTAHAMKGDEEKCRAAGCSGYVTKPIEIDLLLSTVAEALRDRAPRATPTAPPPAAVPQLLPSPPTNLRSVPGYPGVRGQRDQDTELLRAGPLVSKLPIDDPEFREIVEEFMARLHAQLAAMRRALEAGDFEELGRLAHWLKGTGGTAGFPALSTSARHLEALLQDRSGDAIGQALGELGQLAERIVMPAADSARAS